MNLLTIIGYVLAALAIAIGLYLVLRNNSASNDAAETADVAVEPLMVSKAADGTQRIPVVPRQHRKQLAEQQAASNIDSTDHTVEAEDTALQQAGAISPAAARQEPKAAEAEKVEPEQSVDAFDQVLEQLDAVTSASATPQADNATELTESETAHDVSRVEAASVGEWQGESALLDEHLQDQARRDDESALAQAETVVSLYVIPSASRALSGERTMRLLRQFGLRFGEMSLFHRFENAEGTGPLMFSVLRYTPEGPAGFDLETLSTEQVDGLAFFLALPSQHAIAGYDMMVSVAGLLAREIAGQVFDEQMNELTPQLQAHYRHFVLDYRSTAF